MPTETPKPFDPVQAKRVITEYRDGTLKAAPLIRPFFLEAAIDHLEAALAHIESLNTPTADVAGVLAYLSEAVKGAFEVGAHEDAAELDKARTLIETLTRLSASRASAVREYHLIKMVAHAAHHVLDDSDYDEIREASLPSSVDDLETALNAWEAEFPDWHDTMDETRAILTKTDTPESAEPAVPQEDN